MTQEVKHTGHLLFDLVDSKAFGDPMGAGPADANIYSVDAVVSESGTESSASSESTGPDEADSPVDDEEDFKANVLSALLWKLTTTNWEAWRKHLSCGNSVWSY